MNIQDFENIFGNVPFKNIEKIKKYIQDNFISRDRVEVTIEELTETKEKYAIGKPNYQNELQYAIEILQELLKECDNK